MTRELALAAVIATAGCGEEASVEGRYEKRAFATASAPVVSRDHLPAWGVFPPTR